jgi:hypothetical protein
MMQFFLRFVFTGWNYWWLPEIGQYRSKLSLNQLLAMKILGNEDCIDDPN